VSNIVVSGPITVEQPDGTLRVLTIEDLRGPAGASFASFQYEQASASNVWVIDHGLGRTPTVIAVMDSAGTVIYGGVAHPTPDRTVLTFSAAFSGKARLL
jgi:hypothetical protein